MMRQIKLLPVAIGVIASGFTSALIALATTLVMLAHSTPPVNTAESYQEYHLGFCVVDAAPCAYMVEGGWDVVQGNPYPTRFFVPCQHEDGGPIPCIWDPRTMGEEPNPDATEVIAYSYEALHG
jgi:hypothetical protein